MCSPLRCAAVQRCRGRRQPGGLRSCWETWPTASCGTTANTSSCTADTAPSWASRPSRWCYTGNPYSTVQIQLFSNWELQTQVENKSDSVLWVLRFSSNILTFSCNLCSLWQINSDHRSDQPLSLLGLSFALQQPFVCESFIVSVDFLCD